MPKPPTHVIYECELAIILFILRKVELGSFIFGLLGRFPFLKK